MKFRENVDFAASFDKLKEGLRDAEAAKNDEKKEPDIALRYATAYGILSGYVDYIIAEVEEKTDLQIQKQNNENDSPNR